MLARVASKKAHKPPPRPTFSSSTPRSPPSDPLPPDAPRPSDVLVARLNELKRLCKSFAAHYAALAAAEEAKGRALRALAEGETMRVPWLEQSLFLPPGDTGNEDETQTGWAKVQEEVKAATARNADAHLELAKTTTSSIVEPLQRLVVGLKAFIADLDKQLATLALNVVKERDTSLHTLRHLTSSVASFSAAPLAVSALEDPALVRSTAEHQLRGQVARENELLRAALARQERAKEFELGVCEKLGSCWRVWEEARVKCAVAVQNNASAVDELVEGLLNDAEWTHLLSLNYLVPSTTPERDPESVSYPERDHPSTKPVKAGVLERRRLQTWKEAYFVLTPAGYLHEYPSVSSPLSSPSSSLFLPSCAVSSLSEPSLAPKGGKDKPATWTNEGRTSAVAGSVRDKIGLQHRETGRSYRARSTAEAGQWWEEIQRLAQTTSSPHGGGPAGHAVLHAGLPVAVEHERGELSAHEDAAAAVGESADAGLGQGAASTHDEGGGAVTEAEPFGEVPDGDISAGGVDEQLSHGGEQRRQWSIPGHYRVDPEPVALPIASHEGDGAIPPPGGTVEVVAPRQADTPAVAPGGTHAATHGAATSPIDTTADRAEGAGGPAPATEGSPASLPKEKGLLARLSLRRKGRKSGCVELAV